jgi:hypothetical protein
VAVTENTANGETPLIDAPAPFADGVPTHFAVSYDYTAGAARFYVNGIRVGTAAAPLPLSGLNDINVWLGRSQWNDPYFTGSFDEFRIYDGALQDTAIAADFSAGPTTLPGSGPNPGLSIALGAGGVVISWPVTAGFQLETTSDLGHSPIVWTAGGTPTASNGTNKVTVTPSGQAAFFRLHR